MRMIVDASSIIRAVKEVRMRRIAGAEGIQGRPRMCADCLPSRCATSI